MSLVFYDAETTGVDHWFDQILQFSAIRVDAYFNEVDCFEIRSRLLPHLVPSPGALRVNRVSAARLNDGALPSHYNMACQISERLNSWAPCIFLGWNSLKFDEEMLRQMLFKSLHNPYLTNMGGNSRSDVMRMAQACSIYAPEALVFPTDDRGQQIFRLEDVATANGFRFENAHDATADVRACIYLGRLIMEKVPEVWSSFMRFSTKRAVNDFINEEQIFCLSDHFYGKPRTYVVTKIGNNQENPTECYVYDLSVDPKQLQRHSKSELAARLLESPAPVRKLKSNAVPMIFSLDQAPATCQTLALGVSELELRAQFLKDNSELCDRLVVGFEFDKRTYPASIHVEEQIYDGFADDHDKNLMAEFHIAEWEQRPSIVERMKDSRLRKIGQQLIYLEKPEILDPNAKQSHELFVAQRLLGQGADISWLTLPQAIAQIEELLQGVEPADSEFWAAHQSLLRARLQTASATFVR